MNQESPSEMEDKPQQVISDPAFYGSERLRSIGLGDDIDPINKITPEEEQAKKRREEERRMMEERRNNDDRPLCDNSCCSYGCYRQDPDEVACELCCDVTTLCAWVICTGDSTPTHHHHTSGGGCCGSGGGGGGCCDGTCDDDTTCDHGPSHDTMSCLGCCDDNDDCCGGGGDVSCCGCDD